MSALFAAKTFAEFLNLTSTVHDFLFTSKKWMTLRTNLNSEAILTIGRASSKGIATAAIYCNLVVFWVYFWPHLESSKKVAARKEPDILPL